MRLDGRQREPMGGRRALGAVQTLTGAAGPGLRGAPGGRLGAGSAPPSAASPSPKGGCLSPPSPCGAQPRHPRFPTEPRRCSHSGTSTHTSPGGTGTPPLSTPQHPRPLPGTVPCTPDPPPVPSPHPEASPGLQAQPHAPLCTLLPLLGAGPRVGYCLGRAPIPPLFTPK